MATSKPDKRSGANPFVEAGLKAYDQGIAKQKLLEQIVNDAVSGDEPNLASQIGMFVVYVQQLELTISLMINNTYSFKSYFSNKGYSVSYKTRGIIKDNDSLGTLTRLLKTISIRDENTHKQILDDFIVKLDAFVQKRNNYIHKLLKDPGINDLSKLKAAVIKANVELLSLLEDADEKMQILNKLFEIDGFPYSVARHMISSEQYKPRSSKSK